jgi:hypothetical protein
VLSAIERPSPLKEESILESEGVGHKYEWIGLENQAKFAQGYHDYDLYLLRQDLHCSGHRARSTRPTRPEGTPGLVPGSTRTGPKGLLVGSTADDQSSCKPWSLFEASFKTIPDKKPISTV